MILLSYMLDLHLTSLFSTSVPNWNISIWTLTLTLTLPPPPTLAPKQSLSPSFFVFFLVFNHSRSYVCFWLTLQSTSYIPPSHPRPFTKQRKVHQAKVTRIHLTKRIRNLKERETGAILSLILPWCNPMRALTLPLKHLLFVTIYKICHFFELFSFSIHRSRYTACRYHLRYRDPKVYN